MRKRHQPKLHLLSVCELQTIGEGVHGDGSGLVLRISGNAAHFIFRFTAPSGRRREMGRGPVHRNNAGAAGQCLSAARDAAARARALLQLGTDPIDERDRDRQAARDAVAAAKAHKKREQLTLARAARDYHEREVEPVASSKHGAQWLGDANVMQVFTAARDAIEKASFEARRQPKSEELAQLQRVKQRALDLKEAIERSPLNSAWASGDSHSWVGYLHAAPVEAIECKITAHGDSPLITPKDFVIEYWNGSAFVQAHSVTGEVGWTSLQQRTFTWGSSPAPARPPVVFVVT